MKVRTLALGVLASVLMPATAQAAAVVLKVAHFLPPASPAHTRFIVPWCERIKAESKGGLECQIYPAMQLGGTPPQLLTQVRDGVADVVWTLPGYTAGRFPVSEVFELPFITTGREASSRALWDFSQSRASQEFAGMKPIATWVSAQFAEPDEVAKWQAAAGPVTAGWVEEITAKGMDGRSLHEEARALIDKYSK